jgi:hypothetical protein
MVNKKIYYTSFECNHGTEFYLFNTKFIRMISKSFKEQNKTILKQCINTSKPYEN